MTKRPSDFYGLVEREVWIGQETLQDALDIRATVVHEGGAIVAVDPDRNGALVIVDWMGRVVHRCDHRGSSWESARAHMLSIGVGVVLVEQPYTGKFVSAGLSISRLVGAVLGSLLVSTRGAYLVHVSPTSWQKPLFALGPKPAREERKTAAFDYAVERLGGGEVEMVPSRWREGFCDAYGLAEWFRRLPDFYGESE